MNEIFSPAGLASFTDLLNITFADLSDQTLVCFYCNHFYAKHEYFLSNLDTVYNSQLQKQSTL